MENLKKETKLSVREIVFCNEEEKSFCDIFIYEPENVDEQKLGNLYIVGEIVNLSESSSYLINLLASVIKKEFYSKPKRPTMESLEAGLHRANSILSNLAEQGNVDWIGNLNMICGACKENELYFSQVGSAKTLLVRDNQITDIGKNITKEEKPHPFKTFANIASGEIEKNDLVLFATPEFFNIFSLEKTRQIASSLDLEELAEVIQDKIEQEEGISAVGLLIMKIEDKKQSKEKEKIFDEKEFNVEEEPAAEEIDKAENEDDKKIKESKQEDSEEEFLEKKVNVVDDREKITLDDIIERYEETENEKLTAEQKFEQKLKSTTEKQKEVKKEFEEIEKEKSVINNIINKLSGLLKMLSGLFSSVKNRIAIQLKNYKQKRKDASESEDFMEQKTENELLQKINLPSSKNKLIFVAFIFIALLFAGNLIFTDYQKKAEEKFNLRKRL
jgi:serine/threonine protein phosphatase PrpC